MHRLVRVQVAEREVDAVGEGVGVRVEVLLVEVVAEAAQRLGAG